ncbi:MULTISPECIES: NAD(P)H-dependent oxidoreductase [unclassified Cellulophaga]|uniref:NAD(P)H-dependent oxidoreductase n=1 Tax=unclassified Cellulophaga TaxID=2634405 RepID=UPI0026E3AEBD|nr:MULTISPECIES: NAD(P)H-dependent oxidoreductase [unclassified Cellulophaga]MDO6489831.1 NAD(P)H-dependent oxidoreductase [Cellulophaga sp. 2_MG-2023]MDO6494975.1 NAD(P)H-dependent oxidoreductase [Cellulophaga sp. 3_MG-2023]
MKHIFIINAGQNFGHSSGQFNKTITNATEAFFSKMPSTMVKTTHIANGYNAKEEVKKYVWADIIIYHTPIWWFQVPHNFKKYIDVVFTEGHNNGIYSSDGRRSTNPNINYGTGGLMHNKKYMVTSSWNAPRTAFTMPGEFFNETSVDDGPLFGFHKMNAFTGMNPIKSFHFHDVEKNADINRDMVIYSQHLQQQFKD